MLSDTRGAVLIPAFYKNSFLSTGRYESLLRLLEINFNYDIITTDDFTDTSYDIIVVLKSPNKGNLTLMEGIKSIPSKTKVILYLTDLHSNDEVKAGGLSRKSNPFYEAISSMCERADIILCPYKTAFMYKFPEFSDKFRFFPHFVEDSTLYTVLEKPTYRCLLAGATCTKVYPMRSVVENHIRSNPRGICTRLNHPGYFKEPKPADIVGGNFMRFLSRFYCSVTSSSVFNYTIAKYFEIPAAGSLLLANDSGDLQELGFVDGEHYIKVDKDNVIDKIHEVLYNTAEFNHIRHAGQKLVLDNYTMYKAYDKLKKYIKEIL